MRVCIAGKNEIAVQILIYLLEFGIARENIFVIVNQNDDGKNKWQRSLLKKANDLDIEIKSLADLYSIKDLVFLSLEFDKIIKPSKFSSKRLFNLHFSLLPKYRGMFTSAMPILNNEKKTGVTLHKIDEGIDTGEIVAQKEFDINLMDNSRDLYQKYTKYGIDLIKNYLPKILQNPLVLSYSQNNYESSYFSKNSINFQNLSINLNKRAINIHNQIRAFNFREYQIPRIFHTDIISSKILNTTSSEKAGSIILEDDICFIINTLDQVMVLFKDRTSDFFLACKKGDIQLLYQLIQIPKIIDTQNEDGLTPIMIAILNNHFDVVKTLLVNGANLSISDFNRLTPLIYAKKNYQKLKNPSILNLLNKFNSDIF